MKKVLAVSLIFAVILFFPSMSKAQGISLGVGGGLSTMLSPDAFTNNISDGGAGFSAGWHLGAKAKISIPLSPFTPIAFVFYNKFNGSESTSLGEVNTSMHYWSVGVGGQTELIPGPISPYVQVNIAYNNFSDLKVESNIAALNMTSQSGGGGRFGLGLGVGVKVIFVDASLTYNFLNLVGKDDGEETVSTLNLTAILGM